MTTRTTACAFAVALVAGTACFLLPPPAQSAEQGSSRTQLSRSHSRKLFLSAVAEYDAGLRHGTARSSHDAYLRGFRDGTSTEAYRAPRYLVDSSGGYPAAPAPAYSTYSRDTVYAPESLGDPSYESRSVSYGDGYGGRYGDSQYSAGYAQYSSGYAPRGLMNVAIAPAVMAPVMAVNVARTNYCVARYQSFDPASGTFLADDGYRYYCQ